MNDDDVVRSAFDELRTGDARAQSSFDAVLSRPAERRAPAGRSLVIRLAAAGLIFVAVVASYEAIIVRTRRFTVSPEVVALGAWRPTTDALLPPRSDLLHATRTLGGSILDLDTLTTGAFR